MYRHYEFRILCDFAIFAEVWGGALADASAASSPIGGLIRLPAQAIDVLVTLLV